MRIPAQRQSITLLPYDTPLIRRHDTLRHYDDTVSLFHCCALPRHYAAILMSADYEPHAMLLRQHGYMLRRNIVTPLKILATYADMATCP